MVNTFDVKNALQSFLDQDDTPKNLLETLSALQKMRSVVNDRLLKVDKDLDFIKKTFTRHDERQQKAKRDKLTQGVDFFQNLCIFDPAQLKKAIDDEIAAVEAKIVIVKAGTKERLRQKLADAFLEIEDGKIWELGAKKHSKFLADLRVKVKDELRKEFEAEYAAKIAERKDKIAADAKIT